MTLDVSLHEIGSLFTFNVTPYLEDSDTIGLNEQIERLAFERKHGDLTLKLSNRDGYFTTLFANTIVSTRWEVLLSIDDTVRWRGELDAKRIEFIFVSQWVSVVAWSKTKLFWERMKALKLFAAIPNETSSSYNTLRWVFERTEFYADLSDSGTIFSGFDLTTYESRKLRGTDGQPAPIGNEGRFNDLDDSQTYADLFDAFRIYYNCEFYINHDDRKLVMRRRNSSKASTPKEVMMLDDEEVTVSWTDADKCDYISTYVFMPSPRPFQVALIPKNLDPSVIPYSALTRGVHKWRVVYYASGGVPSLISLDLIIELGTPPAGNNCWWVQLDIPPCPVNIIVSRKVFRMPAGGTEYRNVRIIPENSTTHRFTDGLGIAGLINNEQMPNVRGTFNVFRSYDEAGGTWRDDIISTGDNTPSGKILEVQPVLYWLDFTGIPPWPRKALSQYDIYSFFGREADFEVFASQWIDEFKAKRKVTMAVKGIDFNLNDRVTNSILPGNISSSTNYIVKSYTSQIMSERTALTLLSI